MSLRYTEKEEFLERVYRKGNSPQSKKSAQQALDRFTKFCLDKFQRSDDSIISDIKLGKLGVYRVLDGFVAHLQKDGIASSVIHVWMSWLKGYLGYCDIELADNVFRSKVSMPKIHKQKDGAMDREQAARILQILPMKLRLFCLLEATTLRRPHEIIRWKVRDFDFESKPTRIHIPSTIAKNDYETETFTTSEVTALLKEYVTKNRRKPDDLIFQRVTENSATGAFRRFMKQLPELNSRIEGTRRFRLHLYSYKKFGWTRASRKHGDSYADGLKGDKNAYEYHRLTLEEKRDLYLQLEPELTFFNADKIRKELDDKYTDQAKKIEELKKENQSLKKEMTHYDQAEHGQRWMFVNMYINDVVLPVSPAQIKQWVQEDPTLLRAHDVSLLKKKGLIPQDYTTPTAIIDEVAEFVKE